MKKHDSNRFVSMMKPETWCNVFVQWCMLFTNNMIILKERKREREKERERERERERESNIEV